MQANCKVWLNMSFTWNINNNGHSILTCHDQWEERTCSVHVQLWFLHVLLCCNSLIEWFFPMIVSRLTWQVFLSGHGELCWGPKERNRFSYARVLDILRSVEELMCCVRLSECRCMSIWCTVYSNLVSQLANGKQGHHSDEVMWKLKAIVKFPPGIICTH